MHTILFDNYFFEVMRNMLLFASVDWNRYEMGRLCLDCCTVPVGKY